MFLDEAASAPNAAGGMKAVEEYVNVLAEGRHGSVQLSGGGIQ